MGTALLKNAVDANAIQTAPNNNYGLTKVMGLTASGTSQERQGYIYFGRPFPLGVTILSATLRVYNTTATAWTGTQTITAQRTSASWSATRLTWNNKPGVTGVTAGVAKTNPAINTEWAIDVTAMMQAVSDGGVWYGFRLTATGTGAKYIYSAQFGGSVQPTLEVTWSDAPQAPELLKPDGNRAVSLAKPILRCDFTDHSGSTAMASIQVQLNATDVWTSPSFDSGEVATSIPELDLAATAYAGLADTASTFWRVRVKDSAGLWSAWSDSAQFQRQTKGTLTITNPAVSPNNFVFDSTPPISWTFTVKTQQHYQVILSTAANTALWLWDSGKITGSATTVTIPAKKLTVDNLTYNIRVRIWDTIAREGTPNDNPYVEASRDFVFSGDGTVTAVSGLAIAIDPVLPWATLTWTRASAPDKYEITRDNKVVINDTFDKFFVSGTNYQYIDKTADPRVQHTWRVYAVVNLKRDNTGPSVVGTVKQISTYICEADGTDGVLLLNADTSPELKEINAIHETLGSVPPVLIHQSIRGFEGKVSGLIVEEDIVTGRDARAMRDTLKKWREQEGIPLILYMVDEAFEIAAYNITYKPVANPGKTDYLVSFDFFQTDF